MRSRLYHSLHIDSHIRSHRLRIYAYLLPPPGTNPLYALYVPFCVLALSSLFMAATTDPGAVPMGARPIPENLAAESDSIVTERDTVRGGLRRRRGIRRCRKCNDNYKPIRAHHDSVTGRCVVKMDHYCPWVCNAVGIMNHKFFILFILYTFLTAIVCLALLLIRVIRCGFYISIPLGANATATAHSPANDDSFEKQHVYPGCSTISNPIVGALACVTVLFFFFTCCMLIEQGEAVDTNMSKIARMKTRAGLVSAGEYAPVAKEFNEVFGGEHPTMSWHWFLPLPVRFPDWARDNIMGYEWDLTFPSAPYQEPGDTDTDTVDSRLSLGRPDVTDPPLTVDVEAGGNRGIDTPFEQDLQNEVMLGSKSDPVKKRSTGSFT
eukprot:CCRYP_019025-RA/>CCRYP_019025-RA protein AED:0.08 eAED:0.08 QI:424/0.5/0.6/1/0/0.2/5/498/378